MKRWEGWESELTSRLCTRFIMILSGKSIVLATAITVSRACARVGQSNRLYMTVCLRVHNRSNCKEVT